MILKGFVEAPANIWPIFDLQNPGEGAVAAGQKPEPPPPPSITVPSPHPPEGPPPRKRPHEDGPEYGILGQQFPTIS